MKVQVITEELSFLEIAERQIDRAIILFIDDADFISTITLAGAAEEILGKMLNKEGMTHVLDELINGSLKFQDPDVDIQDPKTRKGIASIANYYKNKLKHFDEEASGVHFSSDCYAADLIDRAISNYWKLTESETKQMERFKIEIQYQNT